MCECVSVLSVLVSDTTLALFYIPDSFNINVYCAAIMWSIKEVFE